MSDVRVTVARTVEAGGNGRATLGDIQAVLTAAAEAGAASDAVVDIRSYADPRDGSSWRLKVSW